MTDRLIVDNYWNFFMTYKLKALILLTFSTSVIKRMLLLSFSLFGEYSNKKEKIKGI